MCQFTKLNRTRKREMHTDFISASPTKVVDYVENPHTIGFFIM